MKISIELGVDTYSADFNKNDKIVDGFLEEYYCPVDEAIDAVIRLLSNVYSYEAMGEYLSKGLTDAHIAFEKKTMSTQE